jgi:hypothetical protein
MELVKYFLTNSLQLFASVDTETPFDTKSPGHQKSRNILLLLPLNAYLQVAVYLCVISPDACIAEIFLLSRLMSVVCL